MFTTVRTSVPDKADCAVVIFANAVMLDLEVCLNYGAIMRGWGWEPWDCLVYCPGKYKTDG